jgi:hypothetical protein
MSCSHSPTGSDNAQHAVQQAPATRGEFVGPPAAIAPRLLSLRQAAEYFGCSYWTMRDYAQQGVVKVVELPPLRAREGDRPRRTLRRALIDRVDLDALIERLDRVDLDLTHTKASRAPDIESRARQIEPATTGRTRRSVPAVCPPQAHRKAVATP